ncbi:unnamed protein product [Amaranthus hypochondriacus]
MIGRSWGTVLEVENVYNGMNSITAARLLVKTELMSKIQGRVEVEWEHGACVVWVDEIIKNEGMREQVTSSDEEEDGESCSNCDTDDDFDELQDGNHERNGENEHHVDEHMEKTINGDMENLVEPVMKVNQRLETNEVMENLEEENIELFDRRFETTQRHESTKLLDVDQNENMEIEKVEAQSGEVQQQGFEAHQKHDSNASVAFDQNTIMLLESLETQNGEQFDQGFETQECNGDCVNTNVFDAKLDTCTLIGKGRNDILRQNAWEDCIWVDNSYNNEVGMLSSDRFDPISSIESILPIPITIASNNNSMP